MYWRLTSNRLKIRLTSLLEMIFELSIAAVILAIVSICIFLVVYFAKSSARDRQLKETYKEDKDEAIRAARRLASSPLSHSGASRVLRKLREKRKSRNIFLS